MCCQVLLIGLLISPVSAACTYNGSRWRTKGDPGNDGRINSVATATKDQTVDCLYIAVKQHSSSSVIGISTPVFLSCVLETIGWNCLIGSAGRNENAVVSTTSKKKIAKIFILFLLCFLCCKFGPSRGVLLLGSP